MIEQGATLSALSKRFSGVIWIKNQRLHLTTLKQFIQDKPQPDYAIQGYPVLVDPVNVLGIYKDKMKHKYRAALCSRKNEILFIVTNKIFDGVSLYELAEILQAPESDGGLSCDIAINLDGGPAPALSVDPLITPLEVRALWQLPNVISVSKKPE